MADDPKMLTTFEDICAALADVPARVDLIVHLRSMVVDGRAADPVVEFIEGLSAADLARLWPQLSVADRDAMYGDCGSVGGRDWLGKIEAVIEERRLYGFLVRVETPRLFEGRSYAWDRCTSRDFYADTVNDALRAGLVWAQKTHEDKSR